MDRNTLLLKEITDKLTKQTELCRALRDSNNMLRLGNTKLIESNRVLKLVTENNVDKELYNTLERRYSQLENKHERVIDAAKALNASLMHILRELLDYHMGES